LNTTGFAKGDYAIDVTVTDPAGTPLPGGAGQGHLLVGAPLTAALSLQADLIRLLPGTTVNASSIFPNFPPQRAIDGDLNTSWFTARGDAANLGTHPFIEAVFPSTVTVSQVQLFGNREFATGFDLLAGFVQLFDAQGAELFNSGVFNLPAPDR